MFAGLSFSHLVVTLLVIVLIFGTSKLRTLGSDLGSALKAFKSAVNEENQSTTKKDEQNK